MRRMSLLSNLKDTFIQSVYLLNLESQSQNKSNLKGNEIHCYEYKLSSRRLIVKSNLIESEVHNLFKHWNYFSLLLVNNGDKWYIVPPKITVWKKLFS